MDCKNKRVTVAVGVTLPVRVSATREQDSRRSRKHESVATHKMVLPVSIMRAACDGDSAKVWAWLDAPDAVETRDINDRAITASGTTLLMAAAMRLDSVGLEGAGVLAMWSNMRGSSLS